LGCHLAELQKRFNKPGVQAQRSDALLVAT